MSKQITIQGITATVEEYKGFFGPEARIVTEDRDSRDALAKMLAAAGHELKIGSSISLPQYRLTGKPAAVEAALAAVQG